MTKATAEERLKDTKRGVAILATCIIQEISQTDPTFKDRVLRRIEQAYSEVRDTDTDALDRLELLNWTRELLSGWNMVTGQGKAFLE